MTSSLGELQLRLATDEDVPALRRLVNAAYRELADMGLNFTGTYQDEEITRERMQGKEVYLLFAGDSLVGTISCEPEEDCLSLSQLAVAPDCRKRGFGTYLLNCAARRAQELGLSKLKLDTAQPARHLVAYYLARGFRIVGEDHWPGKTYRSYIMEKRLQ